MAKKTSKKYWEQRAAERMVDYMADAEKTANTLGKAYHAVGIYLSDEAEKVRKTFQNTFNLSEAEARRLIDSASDKSMIDKLKASVSKITDPQKREEAEAIISSPAYAYRIQRMQALENNINEQCKRIYNAELKTDRQFFAAEADKAYKRTVFDMQKGMGISSAFDVMPESRINRILATKWSGEHFSDRVWNNTNALAEGLQNDMLVGIMAGKSEQRMAEDIMTRCGVGAFEARRLVRTETNYIANQAELDGYKECDIERYEFSACLDSRTSEICSELDGKVFPVSAAQPGVNLPPMHPFCRSTTLPELPSEEDLDREIAELGDEIGADVDFDEWVKGLQETEDGKLVYKAESVDKSVITEDNKSKNGFTTAKTIKEAEEYSENYIKTQFGDKTFKGKADFKGISLDNANEINRALENIFSEYDIPKISGIKAIDPNSAKGKKIFSSADAVMAYSPVEHGVYINKSVLKSPEALAAYNKQAAQAWDTVMDNIDSLTGAQLETALRYKNAGRSLVGDGSAHDYFVHEIGHHIQWDVIDTKTNNVVGSRMSQYAGNISGYATTSKSEYFAESFAAFEKGEFDKLDPEYVTFIKSKVISEGVNR